MRACKQTADGAPCVRRAGHEGPHDSVISPPGEPRPVLAFVGQAVQFRLSGEVPQHRAALVVGCDVDEANLMVYPDGPADFARRPEVLKLGQLQPSGLLYVEGVAPGEEPGEWRPAVWRAKTRRSV